MVGRRDFLFLKEWLPQGRKPRRKELEIRGMGVLDVVVRWWKNRARLCCRSCGNPWTSHPPVQSYPHSTLWRRWRGKRYSKSQRCLSFAEVEEESNLIG